MLQRKIKSTKIANKKVEFNILLQNVVFFEMFRFLSNQTKYQQILLTCCTFYLKFLNREV